MRTLISGFLQKKSDSQPFFDYVASEAEKMTQEKFEDLKGRIFRDIEAVKNNHRRQILPRRSATITKESQRVRILPTTTQQASSSTQAAAVPTVTSTTHPAPLALETLHQWSQYRTRAVDNLSGILSQLPDLTTTQIIEQPQ